MPAWRGISRKEPRGANHGRHHVSYKRGGQSQIPGGRPIEPEEIADAVVFVLSDAARAITGVNLVTDLGMTSMTSMTSMTGVPRPGARVSIDRPLHDP